MIEAVAADLSLQLHVIRTAVSRDSIASWVALVRNELASPTDAVRALRALDRSGGRGLGLDAAPAAPVAAAARRSLSQALLPGELMELLPDSGEVIIAATGYLNELPFAILPMVGRGEPFGVRHALRFMPSFSLMAEEWSDHATQSRHMLPLLPDRLLRVHRDDGFRIPGLLEQLERESGDSIRAERSAFLSRALVVGNPLMPRSVYWDDEPLRLEALPGAEREAGGVAELIGVSFLSGMHASETAVRQRLATATIVHLATHGFAYSQPLLARQSFVALAPDAHHDGVLTVEEIAGSTVPRIEADLVVLSACQTALGAPTDAEGTVGLQRAILGKGARSLLVSLWNVSDEATALLMERFYHHWLQERDSPSKAEALRRAQLDVRGRGFGHPRYWVAFQLVGAG